MATPTRQHITMMLIFIGSSNYYSYHFINSYHFIITTTTYKEAMGSSNKLQFPYTTKSTKYIAVKREKNITVSPTITSKGSHPLRTTFQRHQLFKINIKLPRSRKNQRTSGICRHTQSHSKIHRIGTLKK